MLCVDKSSTADGCVCLAHKNKWYSSGSGKRIFVLDLLKRKTHFNMLWLPVLLNIASVYMIGIHVWIQQRQQKQDTISSISVECMWMSIFVSVHVHKIVFCMLCVCACYSPHFSCSAATLTHSQTHISWLDGFSVWFQGLISYLWNPPHLPGV